MQSVFNFAVILSILCASSLVTRLTVVKGDKPNRFRDSGDYRPDDVKEVLTSSQRNRQLSASASASGVPGGCPPQFLDRCACEYRTDQKYEPNPRKKKFFVDCNTGGFRDTKMLQYLPVQTEVLIFTGNQLPILPPNIFRTPNKLPNLRVIDMSNNQLTEIAENAFTNVEFVEILNLAHNQLNNFSLHDNPRLFSNFYSLRELYLTNTFDDEVWNFSDLRKIFAQSNLTRLEKLHLDQNELTVIPDPIAFCTLTSLRQLYMSQNHLTDDVFINVTCLPNLEVIDLRVNKIRTINPKSNLWKLLDAKNQKGEDIRIELLENPFRCDCALRDFISWLKNALVENPDRIRDNEDLLCASGSPVNNTRVYLRKVTLTTCDPLVVSTTASHVASGAAWTLLVLMILLTLGCVAAKRHVIFKTMRPLIHSVSSGVQYTSINEGETAEITAV